MKTTIVAASIALSLLSTAAFAQGTYRPAPPSGTAYGVTYGYGYDDGRGHQHDDDCDHGRRGYDRDGDGDVDRRDRKGRYELRSVQQWVPGQVTQVYVPGVCRSSPSGFARFCSEGRYETRQGPGYYQTVQQWVWVPSSRGDRWGRHRRWD